MRKDQNMKLPRMKSKQIFCDKESQGNQDVVDGKPFTKGWGCYHEVQITQHS